MRMHNSGLSRSAIAEKVGVSVATVTKDVREAVRATLAVPTEEYVAAHLTQLDDLQRAVYARALTGDLDAWDRSLKLLSERAKLLGLNAPQRTVMHVSSEDFATTAASLMRDMGMEPPQAIASTAAQRYTPDPGDPLVVDVEADEVITGAEGEVDYDDWVD